LTQKHRAINVAKESPRSINPVPGINAYSFFKSKGQPFSIPVLEELEKWQNDKILVFSPHQDDDILGCGGTIKRLIDMNAKVRVVYATDGCRGSSEKQESLVSIRKREAIEALNILGCEDYVFLGFEDDRLKFDKKILSAIKKEILRFLPQHIFLVNPFDGPKDHVICSALVSMALKGYEPEVECLNYEIWNPIIPNALVNISDVVGYKEQAIRKHQSQMEIVDYVHHFRGLNAYRAIYTHECTYCEAFLKVSKEEQIRMSMIAQESTWHES